MQFKTRKQSISSSLGEVKHRGHRYYKKSLDWILVRSRLRLARWYLVGTWRIWSGAFRSFRGHIQSQSPIEFQSAGVGFAFQRDQNGFEQLNTRTLARAFYIERLSATLDWAGIVDFRIFLMGFDAGEQWILCTQDNTQERPTLKSSWLYSTEEKFGSVSDKVKQSIAQATKSQM